MEDSGFKNVSQGQTIYNQARSISFARQRDSCYHKVKHEAYILPIHHGFYLALKPSTSAPTDDIDGTDGSDGSDVDDVVV